MKNYDIVIVGGGISGMTAALSIAKGGIRKILIIERQKMIGGLLNQCIHNGFGEKLLGSKVTGPEYTNIIENELKEYNVEIKKDTEVIRITKDKDIHYTNSKEGIVEVHANAILMATGCREKFTGNVNIPINKYTGIYTIGSAQKIINSEGYLPGKNPIVIAKSKWAAIVARRLVIEGANVKALIINEFGDFKYDKEVEDIIEGFDIPVILNASVVDIYGNDRIEGIKINNNGEISSISCDSLIMSVNYYPETELLRNIDVEIDDNTLSPKVHDYMTNIPGIFACGNLIYGLEALIQEEIDGIEAGNRVLDYIKNTILQ